MYENCNLTDECHGEVLHTTNENKGTNHKVDKLTMLASTPGTRHRADDAD